jgi:hypothetical protein
MSGDPVALKETVTLKDGVKGKVAGWVEPLHATSQGRVFISTPGSYFPTAYFPRELNMQWRKL